jgi:hypothetical protein
VVSQHGPMPERSAHCICAADLLLPIVALLSHATACACKAVGRAGRAFSSAHTCSNEACSSESSACASVSCCCASSSSAFLACRTAQHSTAWHIRTQHLAACAGQAAHVNAARCCFSMSRQLRSSQLPCACRMRQHLHFSAAGWRRPKMPSYGSAAAKRVLQGCQSVQLQAHCLRTSLASPVSPCSCFSAPDAVCSKACTLRMAADLLRRRTSSCRTHAMRSQHESQHISTSMHVEGSQPLSCARSTFMTQ